MIGKLFQSRLFRALVTGLILVYLGRRIDLAAALVAIVHMPWHLLVAALVLVAVDRVVMVTRWVLLLRSSRVQVSVRSAAWIYLVSAFLGSFLLAGVGAEAMRAVTLGRRTAERSEAVASVAVDRLLGLLSIVLLGGFGAITWAGAPDSRMDRAIVVAAALVVVVSAAALWIDVVVRTLVPSRWLAGRVGGILVRLADAVGRYRGRRATTTAVLLLSLAVQLLRVAQAWLLGVGLGIDVPFGYYLVFMPIGLLALLLPVSIGGFGFPQGVIVWLLRPRGVPDAQSFALSTLINLIGLAGNLPGLVLYLKSKGAPLKRF